MSDDSPMLPQFGEWHDKAEGENAAIQAYLIVRTILVFMEAYQKHKKDNIAICIGYHDMPDPVFRIQEYQPSSEKIHKAKPREPAKIKTNGTLLNFRYTPEQSYVLKNFSHLLDTNPDLTRCERAQLFLDAYKDEIDFNHCPFCGAIRATPRAKQCLKCHQREE